MEKTKKKWKLRLWFFSCLGLSAFLLCLYGYHWMNINVPSKMKIIVGEEQNFDFSFPIEASVDEDAIGVLYVNQKPLSKDEINIDLSEPFSVSAESLGEYQVSLKLFGIIPVKEVSLEVIEEIEVIPGGSVIGLQIETEGILVLGTGTVLTKSGEYADPAKGLLKSGDYIIGINGKMNATRQDLTASIGENPLTLTIRRGERILHVELQPVRDADGKYRIGTWIRTDAQGIGTLTYMTTTGEFGALGHGITDIDTGLLMDISSGTLFDAEVLSVVKGKSGTPGELVGIIQRSAISTIGKISENCAQGIYGQVKLGLVDQDKDSLPVALKQEIKLGKASILCQIGSEVGEYEVEIERIDLGRTNDNKSLVLRITDKELLKKTGGIVQGMSGSPIIQNGKIIGAVTHVLVNDPARGYGIFIEEMLEH